MTWLLLAVLVIVVAAVVLWRLRAGLRVVGEHAAPPGAEMGLVRGSRVAYLRRR